MTRKPPGFHNSCEIPRVLGGLVRQVALRPDSHHDEARGALTLDAPNPLDHDPLHQLLAFDCMSRTTSMPSMTWPNTANP